jgi:hypothetical protein
MANIFTEITTSASAAEAQTAARYWGGFLKWDSSMTQGIRPQGDQETDTFREVLVSMAHSKNKKFTERERQYFERFLSYLIQKEFIESEGWEEAVRKNNPSWGSALRMLAVDYHPCSTLRAAYQFAGGGVNDIPFPYKTHSSISPGRVIVGNEVQRDTKLTCNFSSDLISIEPEQIYNDIFPLKLELSTSISAEAKEAAKYWSDTLRGNINVTQNLAREEKTENLKLSKILMELIEKTEREDALDIDKFEQILALFVQKQIVESQSWTEAISKRSASRCAKKDIRWGASLRKLVVDYGPCQMLRTAYQLAGGCVYDIVFPFKTRMEISPGSVSIKKEGEVTYI